jgi:aminoglycoside-2''-adenylyltransferase
MVLEETGPPVGRPCWTTGSTLDLYEELAGLIDLLNEAGIDYALCGGMAVVLHGYPRYTKDVDLLVRKEDVERIQRLVAQRGFDLPVARLPFDAGTERERWVHRISKVERGELLSLDLLVVTPVFEAVWLDRQVFDWRGQPIQAVSAEGLAIMKRLAGRRQDLADLENLGLLDEEEGPENA